MLYPTQIFINLVISYAGIQNIAKAHFPFDFVIIRYSKTKGVQISK